MNKDQVASAESLNDIRNALGVLGFLLPVVQLVCNLLFGRGYNPVGVLTSISATYYSVAFVPFIIIVGATGVFLIRYRGYDVRDRVCVRIAGISALILLVFPCALEGAETRNAVMLPQRITNIIHLASAGIFFGSLVYLIGFQFTKTGEGTVISPKSRKWRRNILYRICAILMTIGLAVGFGGKALFGWYYSVYAGEWVALWSFSPAWLTKGGLILPDV